MVALIKHIILSSLRFLALPLLAPLLLAGCSVAAGRYTSHCELPFPSASTGKWRHWLSSTYTTWQGEPNHRVCDLILPPGESAPLCARFTYGIVDKDLEDETVEVWFQRDQQWENWGRIETDENGTACVTVPSTLPPGDYRACLVVLGDGSTADGVIAVWPPHTAAIVSDVDGTLTTSDWTTAKDVLTGFSAQMYPAANQVMYAWAKNGYHVVYLTGRPPLLTRYTRQWLEENGFPRGPIDLADTTCKGQPQADGDVRQFKERWLKEIETRVSVHWTAAYGNALTDIGAYQDVGIPKTDIYIIGPHAGTDGTEGVSSYKDHLSTLTIDPKK